MSYIHAYITRKYDRNNPKACKTSLTTTLGEVAVATSAVTLVAPLVEAYTILGVPYYNYGIIHPETLF